MKRLIAIFLALTLVVAGAGCSTEEAQLTDAAQHAQAGANSKTYALVVKGQDNAYSIKEAEGFQAACDDLGIPCIIKTPAIATAQEQLDIIDALAAQQISGLVISANDADALAPAIEKARAQNIPVVAADMRINGANLFINPADSAQLGALLMEAAHNLTGGAGEFAILSAPTAVYNGWIAAIEAAMRDPKYAALTLVKTADGLDDPNKSELETDALLREYPNLKCIIALTPVGLAAASKIIAGANSPVRVSGMGLPSEMAGYILSGVCPYMYMWNPIEMGYLAGRAVYALSGGGINGADGDTLDAGDMGTFTVSKSAEGEMQIPLGAMLKFEAVNINDWKDVF